MHARCHVMHACLHACITVSVVMQCSLPAVCPCKQERADGSQLESASSLEASAATAAVPAVHQSRTAAVLEEQAASSTEYCAPYTLRSIGECLMIWELRKAEGSQQHRVLRAARPAAKYISWMIG